MKIPAEFRVWPRSGFLSLGDSAAYRVRVSVSWVRSVPARVQVARLPGGAVPRSPVCQVLALWWFFLFMVL